jgi:hypothetical protein
VRLRRNRDDRAETTASRSGLDVFRRPAVRLILEGHGNCLSPYRAFPPRTRAALTGGLIFFREKARPFRSLTIVPYFPGSPFGESAAPRVGSDGPRLAIRYGRSCGLTRWWIRLGSIGIPASLKAGTGAAAVYGRYNHFCETKPISRLISQDWLR